MTGQNELEANNVRRILAVTESEKQSFRDLAIAGGFDLVKDFRFSNLSGLSFAGEDLRGIDFSGANLCGCDFTDAFIEGACFNQARIGKLTSDRTAKPSRSRLLVVDFSRAKGLSPNDNPSDQKTLNPSISDDHLPAGVVFQDSPTAPEMIVLPAMMADNGDGCRKNSRIAISRHSIDAPAGSDFLQTGDGFYKEASKKSKGIVELYCQILTERTGFTYRLPTFDELVFACGSWTGQDMPVINSLGVSLNSLDDVRLFGNDEKPPPNLFRSAISKWCSDFDFPIYLTGEHAFKSIATVSERVRPDVRPYLHVVRELRRGRERWSAH